MRNKNAQQFDAFSSDAKQRNENHTHFCISSNIFMKESTRPKTRTPMGRYAFIDNEIGLNMIKDHEILS
jgi:hypothetical protein